MQQPGMRLSLSSLAEKCGLTIRSPSSKNLASPSSLFRFRSSTSTKALCVLVLTLICLNLSGKRFPNASNNIFHLQTSQPQSSSTQSLSPGDCDGLGGPRRPSWSVDRDDMINALPEFVGIYAQRPIKTNQGGMRFDHSFALWYMLRYGLSPTPQVVIESGAFKGHGTWIIRKALPTAHIYSLSPDQPWSRLDSNVTYYNGKQFIDFGQMQWSSVLKKDAFKDAIVLLDDHQSAYKRIFEQGMKMGFRRFISDDNYGYLGGDNLSMKWLCETKRASEWRGYVADDFGRKKTNQTWKEHIEQMQRVQHFIKHYYEFPPVATEAITGQTRYDKKYTTKPLIKDTTLFKALLGSMDKEEFVQYTHISFVELSVD